MSSQTQSGSSSQEASATAYGPDILGKVILVTGTSPNGLGEEYCFSVAAHNPKLLVLAGRRVETLRATAARLAEQFPHVATKILELDLETVATVKKAAEEVLAWDDVPVIDILVNNAGIMAVDYALTVDGFERQLAVNHLGPWLFTNMLMPKLLASSGPRIVFVGSSGHRWGPVRWHDYGFQDGKAYNRWTAYGQSKTAVLLCARWLGSRLGPKAQVFSLDPGVIKTPLGAHVDWAQEFDNIRAVDFALGNVEAVNGWPANSYITKETAVAKYLYACFGKIPADCNGSYILDCKVADPHKDTLRPWACSDVEAEKLWRWTEELLGLEFDI